VFDACIDIRIPKGYGPHHGCYHMKRRCRWDFAKWSKWSQLKRKALADMNVIQEKFKEYYEHRLFMSSHFEGIIPSVNDSTFAVPDNIVKVPKINVLFFYFFQIWNGAADRYKMKDRS
jgi:hypothetical protein